MTYGGYIAIFGRVMDKHHYHLIRETKWTLEGPLKLTALNWCFSIWLTKEWTVLLYENSTVIRELLPLSLFCGHIQSLSQKCVLRKLFQDHQMAFPSCIASKERGESVTSRWEGSNSCTLAQHPSSCPPFMQQLARWAGHVLAFKRLISINRNKVQSHYFKTTYSQSSVNHQMQWNDTNVSYCVCRDDNLAAGSDGFKTFLK